MLGFAKFSLEVEKHFPEQKRVASQKVFVMCQLAPFTIFHRMILYTTFLVADLNYLLRRFYES